MNQMLEKTKKTEIPELPLQAEQLAGYCREAKYVFEGGAEYTPLWRHIITEHLRDESYNFVARLMPTEAIDLINSAYPDGGKLSLSHPEDANSYPVDLEGIYALSNAYDLLLKKTKLEDPKLLACISYALWTRRGEPVFDALARDLKERANGQSIQECINQGVARDDAASTKKELAAFEKQQTQRPERSPEFDWVFRDNK